MFLLSENMGIKRISFKGVEIVLRLDRKLYLLIFPYNSIVEGIVVGPEVLLGVVFALVIVIVSLSLVLLIEREKRKPLVNETSTPSRIEALPSLPVPVRRTITEEMFKEAKDRLRILELQREILSYAVRRLYEASAEGKITEEEREQLASKYREDLERIKREISRGETIIALNELEKMQEELVKLFSDRLEKLNKKIEELRNLSGFVPQLEKPLEPEESKAEVKEEKIIEALEEAEVETPPETKKKVSKPKVTIEPEKTVAEKRVEEIVSQIEEILKKLEQSEVNE